MLWKECFISKCFMCTISTRNISSPNSLKMWKLCEHTTSFIGNVFAIISNAILCHVVLFLHNLISCCVYSFSFSFLVVYVQNSKKWLIHNYNIKQHNSVLKVVWEYVTKAQSLYNSVEMLFLIWMWWLCSGVQQLPTTKSIIKLKASIPICRLVF